MELNNYEGFQLLNTDETPFYMFKNRGRIIVEKSKLSEATWKERDPK